MTTTVTSMATKASDLDDWTSGTNHHIEGHTPTSPRGLEDLEETGASGSAPSHSPSQSLGRQPLPGHPETQYCLGIHITLIEKRGAAPPPPNAWMTFVVEDMLQHRRAGLTKAVVTGPGRAILVYGRCSLGEGPGLGEARDTTFTLIGADTWVGKLAHLATNPLTIQGGQWVIAQAVTECQIRVRGPRYPHSYPRTPQAFRFYHGDESPREKCFEDVGFDHWPPHHKPLWGRDCEWQQRNLRPVLPQPPPPLLIEESKVIGVWCQ